MSILSVLTLLFLLNFTGVIPFGYDGERGSRSGASGVTVSYGLEWKGPWGTSVWFQVNGETAFSYYFWFKNLPSRIRSLNLQPISQQAKLRKLLTPQEWVAVAKSISSQVPKWMSTRLAPLLDRRCGHTPVYAQYKPMIQPLITLICDIDYEKLITLFENHQYEALKNEIFDYFLNYLKSGKFDRFVPAAQWRPFYDDLNAYTIKISPNLRRMPWQDWVAYFQHMAAGQYKAQLVLCEKYSPGCFKDALAICSKHGLLSEEIKQALAQDTSVSDYM